MSSYSLIIFKARSQVNSRVPPFDRKKYLPNSYKIIEKLMQELEILNKNNDQEALRAVNNVP